MNEFSNNIIKGVSNQIESSLLKIQDEMNNNELEISNVKYNKIIFY